MNKWYLLIMLSPVFYVQSLKADINPAAGYEYRGGSPIIAANILGEPTPTCGDDLSVQDLLRVNFSMFDFVTNYAPQINDQSFLTSDLIHITSPTYQGSFDNGFLSPQWFFFSQGQRELNEVFAYSQTANFYRYLSDELGISSLKSVAISLADSPTSDGPAANPFFIHIPGAVSGGCGNTVQWLEDGGVMPHELGGHHLTELMGGDYNILAEPLGDYWALVMTYHEDNNPEPKIGDWIDEQFARDGVFLRDPKQTTITYPYQLLGEDAERYMHNNGQVLTAALWEMRGNLTIQFGSENGEKLADFLVYNLGQEGKEIIDALPDNGVNQHAHIIYAHARDELVKQLKILQATTGTGTYQDLYAQIDKQLIYDAFSSQNIFHVLPNDPYFDSQITFLNQGGTIENKHHPKRGDDGFFPRTGTEVIGFSTSTASVDAKIPQAWSIQTGRYDITVAILDNGLKVNHQDLYKNIKINKAELPLITQMFGDYDGDGVITFSDFNNSPNLVIPDVNGNGVTDAVDLYEYYADGVDNDSNGYQDDLIGWNIIDDNGSPLSLLDSTSNFGGYSHGTLTSGVIGAMSNNGIGIAGINWTIGLLPVKTSTASYDAENENNILNAYQYAASQSANIISAPWAYSPREVEVDSIYNSILALQRSNILYVAAIGNSGQDSLNDDNDIESFYPQSYALTNIITVTSVNYDGEQYNRYGKYTGDIAAPNKGYTTSFDLFGIEPHDYAYFGGTSGAAPHVIGALGLLLAEEKDRIEENPGYRKMTLGEIRYLLLTSVDPYPSLKNKVVSGGSLNAYKLLLAYQDTDMDGYSDKVENLFGTTVNDDNSKPDLLADSDGDGLSNQDELGYGTIPIVTLAGEDLSGKIYPIYLDDNNHLLSTPTEGGNPPSATDTDGDGMSDYDEVVLGSDPANPFSRIYASTNIAKMEIGGSIPYFWETPNDTTLIWATDEAHSNQRSLKIINESGDDILWKSRALTFNGNAFSLSIRVWSKANNVTTGASGVFGMETKVIFDDFSNEVIDATDLSFSSGTHDWEMTTFKRTFEKPILYVIAKPGLTNGATGVVWIDDVSIEVK